VLFLENLLEPELVVGAVVDVELVVDSCPVGLEVVENVFLEISPIIPSRAACNFFFASLKAGLAKLLATAAILLVIKTP
jgi:hypothetical protein